MKIGVITQVTPTLLVMVGASTVGTAATRLASYTAPAVNDRVLVAIPSPGDRVVLGKIT